MRRADQNHLLDVFLAKTSTASGLSDSSFLTTLDMDPAASTSLTSPTASGLQSPASVPVSAAANLGLFGLGSREPSRAGTPAAGSAGGAGAGAGGAGGAAAREQAQEKGPAFARLGARLGNRFFGV